MTTQSGRTQVRRRREEAAEGSAKLQIKEYKESLVIEAAATLFYERGFQRTTLDDIASALGVTKPFIYTYFESKYSLLERLFDREFDDLFQTVIEFRKLPEKDPVLRFEYFIGTYVSKNLARRGRDFTNLMLQEEKNLEAAKLAEMRKKQHEFDRLFTSLIAEGVKAGVFHVEEPALASLAVSGMIRWIHRWYSPEGRLSDDDIRRQFIQNALRLVGYPPALAVPAATGAGRRTRKAATQASAADAPARTRSRAQPGARAITQ